MGNVSENGTSLHVAGKNMFKIYTLAILATIVLLISVLNIVCIVVLLKSPELKKSRFHCLTLGLTVGDFLTTILVVVLLANNCLETIGLHVPYLCMILSSLVYCSIVFSLFQILFICIERYFATTVTADRTSKLPKRLMQKKVMVLIFLLPLFFKIFINAFELQEDCVDSFHSSMYIYLTEIPIIICLIVIVCLYINIIARLRKLWVRVSCADGVLPEFHYTQRIKRLKINIFTLGFLLIVLVIGLVPRSIVALMGNQGKGNYANTTWILSPLLNPIIYILRFTEFRERIKKTCCSYKATENIDSQL